MAVNFRIRTIIISIVLLSSFSTIVEDYLLYKKALEVRTTLLSETAKTRAKIIKSIIEHHKKESKGSEEYLLNVVKEVLGVSIQNYSGFGKTGEFVLAQRKKDKITFIMAQRGEHPESLSFESPLAVPAKLALTRETGGIVSGKDLRGKNVLAAYEPVGALNLGVVVKIELSEIQKQYTGTAAVSVFFASLIILIGSFSIVYTSRIANRKLTQFNNELVEENSKRRKSETELRQTSNELLSMNEEVNAALEELEATNEELITSQGKLEENLELLHDKEKMLSSSLDEKEILLRELYHRTKNNMQVICGLLHMQSVNANSELAAILQQTENRILSMSIVHKMLYQSKDLSELQFDKYIRELSVSISESYKSASDKFEFVFSLESIPVIIDTAIPCGLVLNELISNSFKHAFTGEDKIIISINLSKIDSFYMIDYSDTGKNINPDIDFRRSKSLGCQLIFMIVENQMKGSVSYSFGSGLHWNIKIPETAGISLR